MKHAPAYLFFLPILILAASPARATDINEVTVTAEATASFIQPPLCGGSSVGATFASTSFSCTIDGTEFQGSATGQTEIGPYGIGGTLTLSVRCQGDSGCLVGSVTSEGSLNWSEEVALEGASGSGFIMPVITASGIPNIEGGTKFTYSLWGGAIFFPPGVFYPPAIPVQFNTPYDLSFSLSQICTSVDGGEACGTDLFEISSISFADANGNPLTGITIEPVPEPSSLCLLVSGLIGLAAFFRIKGEVLVGVE